MSEREIVNNIKKDFYNMVLQFHNNYLINKNKVYREIYDRVHNIYKEINTCRSISDVNICLDKIQMEIKSLKEVYDAKVSIYESMDRKEYGYESAILMGEIRDITNIAQALTDSYSQTRAMISRFTKRNSIKNKFKESKVKNDSARVIEKENVLIDESEIDYSNVFVSELQQLNSKILDLKEKLVSFDVTSKQAIDIRKEINDLCNRRIEIAFQVSGYDGINFFKNIESLETRYANIQSQEKVISYSVDENGYNDELVSVLEVIADLKFFGSESKYINANSGATNSEKFSLYQQVYSRYMNRYVSLVVSLHGKINPVIYSKGEYFVSSNDLLAYLGIYNLRGGYQKFKEHHKNGKIGNEAISRDLYNNGVKNIDELIDSFKKISSDLIKQNGGKIDIINKRESRDEIKEEIDKNMIGFYRMISKLDQDKSSTISM